MNVLIRQSFVFSVLLFFLSIFSQRVFANEVPQTNPKERPVTVTATVPPQGAPPVPILIEPHNNKTLRSGVVLFQWYEVEHLSSISRYELHLNGQPKFAQIHTINQETDDYLLSYDSVAGVYSLRLKQDKWLADGVYTWKIRVIDINNRGTDSTTWTFTIDSTPPPIIVTEIDDDPYAISASDPSTFPGEPIAVHDRSPLIRGKSEASSQMQVIVRYPDGKIWQTYTTTVHLDGSFSIQLGNLPIDTVMHLTFTAIDPATNSTVLDAIDLIYRPREIVIPLPDIFPFPLTIRIRIPGKIIDIPDIFTPEKPQEEIPGFEDKESTPIPPTEQVFTRPVQPRGLFALGAWFGLGWYIVMLFWITGNKWIWFVYFVRDLIKLWIFWIGPEKNWQIRSIDTGLPLPFLGYTFRSLSDKKNYSEYRACSSMNGFGQTEIFANALTHVQSQTKRFVYSINQLHSKKEVATSFPIESLVLDGEDFLVSDRASQPKQIDEHSMILPPGKQIILLFQPVRSEELTRWKIWLPQVGLAVSVVSSLWLAYLQPTWWSFALLVLLMWVGFRDATVQMHKKMTAYAKK